MQEKVIHTTFNRKFFTSSQKNIWAFALRNVIRQDIYFTIAAVILLTIEFATEKSNEFSFGKTIAIGFIFYTAIAWIGIIERRIKLISSIKTQGDRFEKEGLESTYTFNDAGVTYEDKEKMLKLSWHLLKPFEAYKDVIYIKLKGSDSIAISLSRQELGDHDYTELYAILEEKIG
ncbi:hypothetical protein [Mucilaginibacter sp. FT3.2]|uniref:hypothetical protein n=1 Tax=Mucilaginibacter sp. FT3.2 TaxID=2723090 RepID=UPI0016197B9F|nr:hypothetical protein [Mucilaginibacter sp. FT3.2]MBB6233175.1 hypothetical protein [Mucilaginibacter sp. FT3.2]